MVILIADFVASLVTVALPFATIFYSTGLILGQILATSSGPTRVNPSAASGGAYGSTADSSRRELSSPALQEIGRCAAPSSRSRSATRSSGPRCPDRTGRGTGNVEEIIQLTRGWAAPGRAICRYTAGRRALSSRGTLTRGAPTGPGATLCSGRATSCRSRGSCLATTLARPRGGGS